MHNRRSLVSRSQLFNTILAIVTTEEIPKADCPVPSDGDHALNTDILEPAPAPSNTPAPAPEILSAQPVNDIEKADDANEGEAHTCQPCKSDKSALDGIHDRNILEQLAELQRQELIRIEVEEVSIAMRRASVAKSLQQVLQRLDKLHKGPS